MTVRRDQGFRSWLRNCFAKGCGRERLPCGKGEYLTFKLWDKVRFEVNFVPQLKKTRSFSQQFHWVAKIPRFLNRHTWIILAGEFVDPG